MKNAKPIPSFFASASIYQMFLRSTTPEGTLNAAGVLLPSIADAGFTFVYLCPIWAADTDRNPDHWSPRQKKSGVPNPKNPYRMADYFHVDPEYGTDEDLDAFVKEAHRVGLRVMLDLVYLHCGPTAVFMEAHPDFVKRNEDGSVFYGPEWPFPMLNYESAALREYLWSNMTYFVEKYGVDGYRCDVGDGVPLDFWQEGARRVRALRPDFILLNEGTRGEALEDVFDSNYCFQWSYTTAKVLRGEAPVSALRNQWQETADTTPAGGRVLRCIDNHDTASDSYNARIELAAGHDGMEAAIFSLYAMDGIPMLYNGNEICDTNRHSIFWCREYPGSMTVGWQGAMTEAGQHRYRFLQRMNALRKKEKALSCGATQWLDCGVTDCVMAFTRTYENETVLCLVNLTPRAVCIHADIAVPEKNGTLCAEKAHFTADSEQITADLSGWGYLAVKYENQ